ncbi:MAG: Asp-tRNA(Asn)/Glu-tRNA(Gln) amidotransferase subunit GatC [Dehalococcoidia bacterium]|nr:Asp-tRNA(Asn)/Glu-tRNA(Gln) amidotransferase subunit GatC [Dehalococcoidia bacterium]
MLTSDEVRHIAKLARVGMTDADIERLQTQLSNILEHFEALRELDTEGIEPTGHAMPMSNVMREDQAEASLPAADVMANAPHAEEGAFRVRAVLEF